MRMRKVATRLIEPDMTPMIDVVFQLLTFFMIAINFENTKADERVKLPRDSIARPPTVKPEHEIVLNLGYRRDSAGVRLNSMPDIFYNDRYIDVTRISPNLEQERRVMERLHGKDSLKDVTVLVRADSEVPTGLVQELVKRCQEVGFSRFSLRASGEGT